MKTTLRFTVPFLAAGLLVLTLNIFLTGLPAPASQARAMAEQERPLLEKNPPPTGQTLAIDGPGGALPASHASPAGQISEGDGPITISSIQGLTISHSIPTLINIPIHFTASILSGTPPITYVWIFGDGTTLSPDAGPVVSHSYKMTGTFTVTVKARNIAGTRTATRLVTVEAEPVTGLSISHSTPTLIQVPIHFTASIACGSPPISYSWNFGDGTILPPDAGPAVSHTYDMTGTYTVVVTAFNLLGPVTRMIIVTVDGEPVAGLNLVHSTPVTINVPVFFTTFVGSGSLPISYAWDFDDGPPVFTDTPTISHTYTMPGFYLVTVAAFNGFGNPASAGLLVAVPPFAGTLYLPLFVKEVKPLADLTCKLSVDTSGDTHQITVAIHNRGHTLADGFWVDLYINPNPLAVPEPGKLFPWEELCKANCPGGMAWDIDTALLPGITRTLVSTSANEHPDGYNPTYSVWSGTLPPGTHNLFAYVDSIENADETSSGAVLESDETNNLCQVSGVEVLGTQAPDGQARPIILPPRPGP